MKKPNRAVKVLIIFVFFAAAWIFFAPFLATALIVEKTPEKADVIVVLGGSSAFIERTQAAARLFRQRVAPKIILTNDGMNAGWSREEGRNPAFVELARQALISQGVAPEAIEILPEPVSGTSDEAALLRTKAELSGWKSILIVTSAYHTRRALWIFEKFFAGTSTEIGVAAAPAGQQTPPPSHWWLTARGWETVAGEYVKSLYYRIYF